MSALLTLSTEAVAMPQALSSYLGYISAISRLYLGYISVISRLYLGYISAISLGYMPQALSFVELPVAGQQDARLRLAPA